MAAEEISEKSGAVATRNVIAQALDKIGARKFARGEKIAGESEMGVVRNEGVGEADVAELGGVILLFEDSVTFEEMTEEVEIAVGFADVVEVAQGDNFFDVEVGGGMLVMAVAILPALSPTLRPWVTQPWLMGFAR